MYWRYFGSGQGESCWYNSQASRPQLYPLVTRAKFIVRPRVFVVGGSFGPSSTSNVEYNFFSKEVPVMCVKFVFLFPYFGRFRRSFHFSSLPLSLQSWIHPSRRNSLEVHSPWMCVVSSPSLCPIYLSTFRHRTRCSGTAECNFA